MEMSLIWIINQHPSNVKVTGSSRTKFPTFPGRTFWSKGILRKNSHFSQLSASIWIHSVEDSRANRSEAKVFCGRILTFPNSVLLFGSIPSIGWNFVLLHSNPWDMTEAFPWSIISMGSSVTSRWFLIVNTFSGVLCQKWKKRKMC